MLCKSFHNWNWPTEVKFSFLLIWFTISIVKKKKAAELDSFPDSLERWKHCHILFIKYVLQRLSPKVWLFGTERLLGGEEHWVLLKRTQIWFPEPVSGNSHPFKAHNLSYMGANTLCVCVHAHDIYKRYTHVHADTLTHT